MHADGERVNKITGPLSRTTNLFERVGRKAGKKYSASYPAGDRMWLLLRLFFSPPPLALGLKKKKKKSAVAPGAALAAEARCV